MDQNLDKVFVTFEICLPHPLPVVEWVLNHFDPDEFMIIFAPLAKNNTAKSIFQTVADNLYIPKCTDKKFRAELLIPGAAGVEPSILELIIKHGMRKLVIPTDIWNGYKLSKWFDARSNLSCKIWIVNEENGKLDSSRVVGSNASTEEFLQREKEENKQLKRNVLHLRQENRRLKLEVQKLRGKSDENLKKLQESNEQKQELQRDLKKIMEERDKLKEELDNVVKDAEELRKERKDILDRSHSTMNPEFTWLELEQATQNFSDSLKIGKGGYGCVYKGHLRGTDVAIKILNSQSMENIVAFKQEVAILTTVRHPNLVTLMGACSETSTLIYEFLPNGSLEDHLNHANNTTPLSWQVRTRIISEICLALIFLHSNTSNLVIHGDLKPDNVLLDANFVSKLCDFGISRLIKWPNANTTPLHFTYNLLGTPGYMDPEFVTTLQLTEKPDVYSFGVIILRLVTGKPATSIAHKVQEAMQKMVFPEMIDVSAGKWPIDQAEELAMLGLRCTQMCRRDRPNLFNEIWPIVERLRRDL